MTIEEGKIRVKLQNFAIELEEERREQLGRYRDNSRVSLERSFALCREEVYRVILKKMECMGLITEEEYRD
jgi:hypothetical protein